MEGIKFFKLLKKHRFTLIAIPMLITAITFVLVKKMPNTYLSSASLSAGLVDPSQQLISDRTGGIETKVNQSFSNLLQMMLMKNVVEEVSYQLIIHDLSDSIPYRPLSKLINELPPSAREHALAVYKDKYNKRQTLSLLDPDQKGLAKVIASMHYDYGSLLKKVRVYRIEHSDFINVEFESESPLLSAVVVNTLCSEFITYYASITKENELNSVAFLNKLLETKKDTLNKRIAELKKFKINNRVLNLGEQAKSLYTQIADFETRIQMVKKDIASNEGALKSIDNKFNPEDRKYLQSTLSRINQEILETKQSLEVLTEASIKNNFAPATMKQIEAQKKVLAEQVNLLSDKYLNNPLASKEALLAQRLNIEINNELAKSSLKSLEDELIRLTNKFDRLVPNEAVIQAFEGDINTANQEYIEILKKYNESSLEYNTSVRLRVLENANPGTLQPSKKIIIVAFSGLCSLILCVLILFVLFYLDDTLKTPQDLANKTNLSVMGYLPMLQNMDQFNIEALWTSSKKSPELYEFKNQLRSIRFEIDNLMHDSCLLINTSMAPKEGKTLFSICLAYAYTMIGKKVMHIDGNFASPAPTDDSGAKYYIEDYLTGRFDLPWTRATSDIFYFTNKGMDISLFEIADENTIIEKLSILKKEFDVILIETAALDTLSQAKEWIKVSDKVVVIFDSNKALGAAENQLIDYLKTQGSKFLGWVMNRVTEAMPTTIKTSTKSASKKQA